MGNTVNKEYHTDITTGHVTETSLWLFQPQPASLFMIYDLMPYQQL